MKYYDSIRKKAGKAIATENRRRVTSIIQEETDGENTPLLGGSHSINNAAEGFLVSYDF